VTNTNAVDVPPLWCAAGGASVYDVCATREKVTYYRTENRPKEVWARPERIVMHKPHRFADQCEYRFAFSTKADAFDFENVNLTLAQDQPARLPLDSSVMLLKLGPMSDCCRIHRF